MSLPAVPLRLETPKGVENLTASGDLLAVPLSSALARMGHPLNTRCGGRGLCQGCTVEVHAGHLRGLDGAEAPASHETVRSCQVRLPADGSPVALAVPNRSLLDHAPAVVSNFKLGVSWAEEPMHEGRAVAAVDVGTTTVALLLCQPGSGKVLAEASAFNGQIGSGEDVLTRINLCAHDSSHVARLQRAVAAETIQPLLEEACSRAGVPLAEVAAMAVAGNTTMQHLLAGVDPTPLGTHPFTPVFLEHRVTTPAELGLSFGGKDARVHLLPGPASYVGADLAAGMVATGLIYRDDPVLLVDVGTNGEIIAKVGDRLLGCATAAGPAFEGAGLLSGMRAVTGVIETVRFSRAPYAAELGLIGGPSPRPVGICGSAYVDFLAEGRRRGLLEESGRYTEDFVAEAGENIVEKKFGRALRLHPAGASGPILVSELDIARLLQAKAAISAGIRTLLDLLGVSASDIRTLYLAGGFGLHLDLPNAIGCGLLPGFRPEQIEVVGNTSLGGAYLALNDRALLEEMKLACRRMESIELNLQPGFEDAYIDALTLP